MRKYFIAFGCAFLIAGCSIPTLSKKVEPQTKTMPKPAIKKSAKKINIENFYVDATNSGLTLLNTDDDSFSMKLSDKEIGDASITDGVLTFTELLPEGENVRVINLKAYSEKLNK